MQQGVRQSLLGMSPSGGRPPVSGHSCRRKAGRGMEKLHARTVFPMLLRGGCRRVAYVWPASTHLSPDCGRGVARSHAPSHSWPFMVDAKNSSP